MLDFEFEDDARDAEPGLVPKLITLAGLVIFWAWILWLIF